MSHGDGFHLLKDKGAHTVSLVYSCRPFSLSLLLTANLPAALSCRCDNSSYTKLPLLCLQKAAMQNQDTAGLPSNICMNKAKNVCPEHLNANKGKVKLSNFPLVECNC